MIKSAAFKTAVPGCSWWGFCSPYCECQLANINKATANLSLSQSEIIMLKTKASKLLFHMMLIF